MSKRKREEYYIYEPCNIVPGNDLSEEEKEVRTKKIQEETKELVEKLKIKYKW